MILDTTFLIDVLRGDVSESPTAERLIADLDASGTARVSAVSVVELWEGIHLSETTQDGQAKARSLLDGLHVVPLDHSIGMLAGELSADLISRGERIELEDVMIGATALLEDEAVVTRNVEHFDRLADVEVVTY
jgi:predicted nucleic acid-binding protein